MIATYEPTTGCGIKSWSISDAIRLTRNSDGSMPLPLTVVIPARMTLLASLVKKGIDIEFIRYSNQLFPTPRSISRFRDHRKQYNTTTKNGIFGLKSMVGKLVSVEIEYYPNGNVEPQETATTIVKCDGSLDRGGIEVCKVSWVSESRIKGIQRLSIKGSVNKRCGLHVHVDTRHLSDSDFERVYTRLLSLSRWFKRLVPKSRLRNKYCRWKNNLHEGDRYCAFNSQSRRRHGTIEFRMQGNFNPVQGRRYGELNMFAIENWALLCVRAFRWAEGSEQAPNTWVKFVNIFDEPIRSWAILRYAQLQSPFTANERSMAV